MPCGATDPAQSKLPQTTESNAEKAMTLTGNGKTSVRPANQDLRRKLQPALSEAPQVRSRTGPPGRGTIAF